MLNRRLFLRALAAAGVTGGLAACGVAADQTNAVLPTQPTTPPSAAPTAASPTSQPATKTPLELVAPEASADLNVINASFEQLTGRGRPFAFGLVGPDNAPFRDADVQVYVVTDAQSANNPTPAEFRDVPGQPLGLYLAILDLPDPGQVAVVVVTADGQRGGQTGLQVASPDQAQVIAPGDPAISVATPTQDNPGDFGVICTLDPPCGMHEISLDDALTQGRPVMLTFATPAFCATAICGPSVEVMDEVRQQGEWGEVAWIHVEVFLDSGQTLGGPIVDWGLQSEPWLFSINADGTVADRIDGPLLVLPDQVQRLARQVA